MQCGSWRLGTPCALLAYDLAAAKARNRPISLACRQSQEGMARVMEQLWEPEDGLEPSPSTGPEASPPVPSLLYHGQKPGPKPSLSGWTPPGLPKTLDPWQTAPHCLRLPG